MINILNASEFREYDYADIYGINNRLLRIAPIGQFSEIKQGFLVILPGDMTKHDNQHHDVVISASVDLLSTHLE